MIRLVSLLIFVFAVSFSTQAQKKKGRKGPNMTTTQQATLKVKKMTLVLDLNAEQQQQIMPLITKQIEGMRRGIKARKSNKKPNDNALFKMKNKRLDAQIMMKNKMKQILTAEQFQEFKKMAKTKRRMGGKKMKHQKSKRGKKRRSRE